jgi:hypothetical protein
MMREFEKKVFENIDFPNKYLTIKRKYRNNDEEKPIIKKVNLIKFLISSTFLLNI